MGIKGLYKWLLLSYPNSVLKSGISVECLLVDLNFLLYYHAYSQNNLDELIKNIQNHLFCLVKRYNSDKLVICLDGKPPDAKMDTIKKRIINRKEMAFDFSDVRTIEKIKTSFIEFASKLPKIIPVNVTTLFGMKDESEFKMIKYIVSYSYSSYGIVSNDADIILLSIMHSQYKNIFVINLKPKNNKVISISILIELLKNDFNSVNLIYDFPLILLFLGNDYIPKLSFISENVLLETYKKFIKSGQPLILENKKLNYEGLILFFQILINNMHFYRRIRFSDLDSKKVECYLNGIKWCFECYCKATCIDDTFKCHNIPIHPLGILCYLLEKLKF